MFDRVIRNGHDQVDKIENAKEQEDLRNKLSEAETKWRSLIQKYKEHSADIDRLYPLSQKYSEDAVTFSIWLEKTEKKKTDLENEPLYPNENDLERQRKESEVCSELPLYFASCVSVSSVSVLLKVSNIMMFTNNRSLLKLGERRMYSE